EAGSLFRGQLLNLDLKQEGDAAFRSQLLSDAFLPSFRRDAAPASLDDLAEMQKQDPLATQIWKLYSRTRSNLPNQERMENLTWRMMSMTLKREQRQN
ncbi:hypothetical protein TWF679_002870, partial [Orbilia oligospora]